MDSQTASALAAWAAAGVAAIGATFQFFIGRKQASAALVSAQAALINAKNAGRHTQAELRQKWIDKVIDALSEHNGVLLTADGGLADDRRKLAIYRTRLELLLNPTEADPIKLMQIIDSIPQAVNADERADKALDAVHVARRHLKEEWVRIKTELS